MLQTKSSIVYFLHKFMHVVNLHSPPAPVSFVFFVFFKILPSIEKEISVESHFCMQRKVTFPHPPPLLASFSFIYVFSCSSLVAPCVAAEL